MIAKMQETKILILKTHLSVKKKKEKDILWSNKYKGNLPYIFPSPFCPKGGLSGA